MGRKQPNPPVAALPDRASAQPADPHLLLIGLGALLDLMAEMEREHEFAEDRWAVLRARLEVLSGGRT